MKKLHVTKPFLPPFEEYIKEIKKVWETNWLTNNGPLHEVFQEKLEKYLKIEHITLFTNGHLALETAIKSFDFKEGDEIITTPFTFASTTHAIVNLGLKPVFCDIRLDDYTMDTDKIEALITEKTVAILPVHIFGYPVHVSEIERIAKCHHLKVIYDAAHAFGLEVNKKPIASFGDCSMFSFHATKVFHSIEGGGLAYSNHNFSKKLHALKNFGILGPETIQYVGTNAKMNEFQSAMGLTNLRYVDSEIAKRKLIVEAYRRELKDIKGIRYLEDLPHVKHNYSYFPVLIDGKKFGKTRDQLFEELKKYSIFTRKYFYPLITDFDCYKEEYKNLELPHAKLISNQVLTLPLYTSLSIKDVQYISEKIREIHIE